MFVGWIASPPTSLWWPPPPHFLHVPSNRGPWSISEAPPYGPLFSFSNPDTVYPWLWVSKDAAGQQLSPSEGKLMFHILVLCPAPQLYARQPHCFCFFVTGPTFLEFFHCALVAASGSFYLTGNIVPCLLKKTNRNNSFLSVFCNHAFTVPWINLLPCLRTLVLPFSISLASTDYLTVFTQTVVFADTFFLNFSFLLNVNQTLVLYSYVTFIWTLLGQDSNILCQLLSAVCTVINISRCFWLGHRVTWPTCFVCMSGPGLSSANKYY